MAINFFLGGKRLQQLQNLLPPGTTTSTKGASIMSASFAWSISVSSWSGSWPRERLPLEIQFDKLGGVDVHFTFGNHFPYFPWLGDCSFYKLVEPWFQWKLMQFESSQPLEEEVETGLPRQRSGVMAKRSHRDVDIFWWLSKAVCLEAAEMQAELRAFFGRFSGCFCSGQVAARAPESNYQVLSGEQLWMRLTDQKETGSRSNLKSNHQVHPLSTKHMYRIMHACKLLCIIIYLKNDHVRRQ